MTDRVPGAPGQYKAVITEAELQKMQTGEQFTITMTRDDQPVTEGTPYSKAAVLPDELAQLLCPDKEDPTPADALAALLPLSGGTMTGPLTLAYQNLTGLRAVSGVRMGGLYWDGTGKTSIALSHDGDGNTSSKWSMIVGAVAPGSGCSSLYFVSGESSGIVDKVYKICGNDTHGISFTVPSWNVLEIVTSAWSHGWYMANSIFQDLNQ